MRKVEIELKGIVNVPSEMSNEEVEAFLLKFGYCELEAEKVEIKEIKIK